MRIEFEGLMIQIIGNPATDGKKEFTLTDTFWEKWNADAVNCKRHGFSIKKEDGNYIGIYSPYAIYAQGTKRLERQSLQVHPDADTEFYASDKNLDKQEADDSSPASPEFSAAEKHEAIKSVIDTVGFALSSDNSLSAAEKLSEWVAILEWGVEMLPVGFEKTKQMLLEAISNPRHADYDAELMRRQRKPL